MPRKKQEWIQMRVEHEFKELVEKVSSAEFMTMSQFIKVAVKDYVKRLEQPLKVEITPRHRNLPSKD